MNEAKDRLASVNDQLSDANNELLRINEDLKNEISERKRVEVIVLTSKKKLVLLLSIHPSRGSKTPAWLFFPIVSSRK